MSIQEGNDFDQARLGKYLVGVYYYALSLDKVMSDDSAVIGFCNTIQTVAFNPFIDFEEFRIVCLLSSVTDSSFSIRYSIYEYIISPNP